MERKITWVSNHYEFDGTGRLFQPDDNEYDEEFEKPPIAMATPFGLFRIDDSLNPVRQFKLWMGHTNFDITPEVAKIIEQVEGVEILKVITRYRFIIGIGEQFDSSIVKMDIMESLCSEIEEVKEETLDDVLVRLQASNINLIARTMGLISGNE